MGIIADTFRARIAELKASDDRTTLLVDSLIEENRKLRAELAALRFDDSDDE